MNQDVATTYYLLRAKPHVISYFHLDWHRLPNKCIRSVQTSGFTADHTTKRMIYKECASITTTTFAHRSENKEGTSYYMQTSYIQNHEGNHGSSNNFRSCYLNNKTTFSRWTSLWDGYSLINCVSCSVVRVIEAVSSKNSDTRPRLFCWHQPGGRNGLSVIRIDSDWSFQSDRQPNRNDVRGWWMCVSQRGCTMRFSQKAASFVASLLSTVLPYPPSINN
jgi:hypothetical protein